MAVQERIGRAGAQPALLLFNCASVIWQAGSGGIAVGGAHDAGSTTDHAVQALHDAARAAPRPVPEGGIANDPGPTTDHAVQALHDAARAALRPVPEGEIANDPGSTTDHAAQARKAVARTACIEQVQLSHPIRRTVDANAPHRPASSLMRRATPQRPAPIGPHRGHR